MVEEVKKPKIKINWQRVGQIVEKVNKFAPLLILLVLVQGQFKD